MTALVAETVTEQVRRAMGELGVTQHLLAAKSGVAQQQLSGYLTGRTAPSLAVLQRLASALGITLVIYPPELIGKALTEAEGTQPVFEQAPSFELPVEIPDDQPTCAVPECGRLLDSLTVARGGMFCTMADPADIRKRIPRHPEQATRKVEASG